MNDELQEAVDFSILMAGLCYDLLQEADKLRQVTPKTREQSQRLCQHWEEVQPKLLQYGESVRAAESELASLREQVLALSVATDEARELDAINSGATGCAQVLATVARENAHPGTFGGEKVEEAAQIILQAIKDAKLRGVRAGLKAAANKLAVIYPWSPPPEIVVAINIIREKIDPAQVAVED